MGLDLRTLIQKLGPTSRSALEAAVAHCVSRKHYDVRVEHWFLALLETRQGDVCRILEYFSLDPDHASHALTRALERLPTGNGGPPELNPTIERLVRDAWLLTSINYHATQIRSGALLLASFQDLVQGRRWSEIYPASRAIEPRILAAELPSIVTGSCEDQEASNPVIPTDTGSHSRDPAPVQPHASGATALDQFTIDLTRAARNGELDPVLGRDREIRQLVDILSRKRQNNPILTGEAGVGKTAIVEGLAQRIVQELVPERLRTTEVRSLDLGSLQAGAGVKGEFEKRLKQVVEAVRGSPVPIVLFIDEAHTLIGAGGAAGQQDAANLLKPALARGELRTIAATTWSEYKRFFEKDPALSRRFQVVKVEEPDEAAAIEMMRGIAADLERHHGVAVLEDAIVASVQLSARYIAGRQLPDKSVSLLDTACARVRGSQHDVPAPIEDLRRRRESLLREAARLEQEGLLGREHAGRQEALEHERLDLETELGCIEQRWERERKLVGVAHELREQLLAGTDAASAHYASVREELRSLQANHPLVACEVDAQAVAEVVSSWTGIPVGRMLSDEISSVLSLASQLERRVVGQTAALETIAKRIHTARAGLDPPGRPQGVFLLVGPSGVGKTETALALAETLYGGERNLITINLSEYQEPHTVSALKGSPPGYVGYGEGGVLTEAVRRRPYSVILLDEAEKAHPNVLELFLQVFDKGSLEDGDGRSVAFDQTVVLLASNTGSEKLRARCSHGAGLPSTEELEQLIHPDLRRAFPDALLGRLVVVPFYPLSDTVLSRIVELKLDQIARRLAHQHGTSLHYGPGVCRAVIDRCRHSGSGARAVDRILTDRVLPSVSAEILACLANGTRVNAIGLEVDPSGEWQFEYDRAQPKAMVEER